MPVAVAGEGRGGRCRVVHSELVDRTGDAPPSLDAVETSDISDVASSTAPRFVRKAGLSESSRNIQGEPPKVKAESSVEGEDALDAFNASYQEKTIREIQRSMGPKTYL